jgi:hypothetical protein
LKAKLVAAETNLDIERCLLKERNGFRFWIGMWELEKIETYKCWFFHNQSILLKMIFLWILWIMKCEIVFLAYKLEMQKNWFSDANNNISLFDWIRNYEAIIR